MIHGTAQYSSVRPFARHDDGSFGTLREMEKTVERHFGLRAKNEKWRSWYCSERGEETERGRQTCARAWNMCICACLCMYACAHACIHVHFGVKNFLTALWHVEGCVVVYSFRLEQSNTWRSIWYFIMCSHTIYSKCACVRRKHWLTYRSVVCSGMCGGKRVSLRLEQSTTVPSQRHLSGHTRSWKHSPLRRLR